MTIKHICCLLEFCLKNTYFKFTGEFYAQQEEAAMGSPISPVMANLFMEDLEMKAIRTSNTPSEIWRRYVDDTCTIIKVENKNIFLQHLNFIHSNIKFTCEEMKEDGLMPFLDILIIPTEHGSVKTSVFRKHTHTYLYLQWDSHHSVPSKYSVAGTLYHRANTICSHPTVLHEEEQHLFKALRKCKYPIWAIHRAKLKSQNPNRTKHKRTNNQKGPSNTNNQKLYMLVPYHQGLSEKVQKTCSKYGVQVHFHGGQTIKSLLMAPKESEPMNSKSRVIYRYQCKEQGCGEEYIGESGRTFAERFTEHQQPPSPIFDHCNTSGHNFNINKFTLLGREEQNVTRAIKEAILIRVNDPSLNRNVGK